LVSLLPVKINLESADQLIEVILSLWKRQYEINNSVVKRLKSLNGIPQDKILNLLEPFSIKIFENCSKNYMNILCENITKLLEIIWSKDNYMTTPEHKYIFTLTKYIFNHLCLEMTNYLSKCITDINKAKMAYRILNDIILKMEPKIIRGIQSLNVLVHELKKTLTNQQEIENLQKILQFLDY